MDAPILAALITAAAAIVGPIVTFYFTKARFDKSAVIITRLGSRGEVYEKAASLIREGRDILDTSWGSDEANRTNADRAAFEVYNRARRSAVARDNTRYRELFSLTDDPERRQKYQEALVEAAKQASYLVMLIDGFHVEFPMIDFLVVDGEHVILSLLSSDSARSADQYFLLRSKDVAKLLIEYFDACWDYATRYPAAQA